MKLRASILKYLPAVGLAAMLLRATALHAAPPASPAKLEIQKSVFITPASPEEGRDPFFPNCKIIYRVELPSSGTGRPAESVDFTLLKVSGMSRSGTNVFVVINNRSFAVGEEGVVSTSQGRVQLRVVAVDMKAQSVTVQIANGQRGTLFMPSAK